MEVTRESIFVSAVRSFFNAFFALVGVLVGIVIIALVIGSFAKPKNTGTYTEMVIEPNAEGDRTMLSAKAPVILRIDIHGPIGPPKLTYQMIEAQLADSRSGLFAGDRVKAILLHCNTPGGTETDSAGIYHRLMAYKKRYKVPVYAFTEGLCASGGIFISSAAEKSYATEMSIIGSVGVIFGPLFNYSKLMEKVGIESKSITAGKNKELIPQFTPWGPDAGAVLEPIAKHSYNVFLDIATKARPRLSREKLINEYGAKIFDAPQAQEYGYIDNGSASYGEALTALAEAAGIEGEYQVVRLKAHSGLIKELIEMKSPIKQLREELGSASTDQLLYLYRPQ